MHTWVTENWFDALPAPGITGEVGATLPPKGLLGVIVISPHFPWDAQFGARLGNFPLEKNKKQKTESKGASGGLRPK